MHRSRFCSTSGEDSLGDAPAVEKDECLQPPAALPQVLQSLVAATTRANNIVRDTLCSFVCKRKERPKSSEFLGNTFMQLNELCLAIASDETGSWCEHDCDSSAERSHLIKSDPEMSRRRR